VASARPARLSTIPRDPPEAESGRPLGNLYGRHWFHEVTTAIGRTGDLWHRRA